MRSDQFKMKQKLLLGLPFLLIPSTALVFVSSDRMWGNDWGYVVGFLFYWLVWCYLVPFIFLGRKGFINLFRKERASFFTKRNWYLFVLLFTTIIGAFILYFLPKFDNVSLYIVLLAIPIAVIAGVGEEILWRGLYVRSFPGNIFLAYLYPTIWFALQHFSPELTNISASTPLFIVSTLPLGLVYGFVTYRTGSIRWNSLAHVLISFLAFGEPISPSIYHLINPS